MAGHGLPPLGRQPSIYSLTFDEFQNSLGGIGKDFVSMNMDEFLRNIWTAEETQAMASAAADAAAMGGAAAAAVDGMGGLQRQGSLTLPRTLSQKTVDEVWRDLFREDTAAESNLRSQQQQQRQSTLGEMTLEEFLVRAGVVKEDLSQQQPASRPDDDIVNNINNAAATTTTINNNNNNSISGMFFEDVTGASLNSNPGLALGFSPVIGRRGGAIAPSSIPNNSSNNVNGGEMMGIGDPVVNSSRLMPAMARLGPEGVAGAVPAGSPANPLSLDGLRKNGDLSSLSPVPYSFNGGFRGRRCSGAVEKVVERRQKRMIKNRESAARSRARKQAYTMELEAEVAKLKEKNQELQKKQEEILEMQKNQVLEMSNQQCGSKKLCLRRTQTGPW